MFQSFAPIFVSYNLLNVNVMKIMHYAKFPSFDKFHGSIFSNIKMDFLPLAIFPPVIRSL